MKLKIVYTESGETLNDYHRAASRQKEDFFKLNLSKWPRKVASTPSHEHARAA